MIQRFSNDLSRQDIYANGAELAQIMGKDKDKRGRRVYTRPDKEEQFVVSFKEPVLFTDNYRIAQLPPELRDTVFALFGSPVKTTEYDGTSVSFEQKKYPGVWGPNIDTVALCRGLYNADLQGVKTAIEIGSGSG